MPLYERDSEGKLVPVTEGVPEEAIRAIERFDESAIAHRLTTGLAREEFIYHYPIKTATGVKEIVGISTDGADEIARMLGNIEVLPDIKVDKDSDPDYFYVMVRAKDLIRNVTLLGTGRACKYQLGKGNQPDHDRPNEWAFVISVSKAQRNAILHLTAEEIIIKIVNNWAKMGKAKQIIPPKLEVAEEKPPTPTPTTVVSPAVTPQKVAEQEERLKKLRMQVHNMFQTQLGIGVDERKEILNKKFNVGSLTDLNEQQLNECLSYIEEQIQERTIAPSAKPQIPIAEVTKDDVAKSLGFESLDEQNKLRGRLYSILTSPNQLNLKDEEAKKFITDRGLVSTAKIQKTSLLQLIQETNELVKAKQTPTEF